MTMYITAHNQAQHKKRTKNTGSHENSIVITNVNLPDASFVTRTIWTWASYALYDLGSDGSHVKQLLLAVD